jgi:putative ABC transport system substrate-binding protein
MKEQSERIAHHSAPGWGEAMKKTVYLFLIIAMAALSSIAEAQQPAKAPQIGVLSLGRAAIPSARVEAFQQGLRDLGYIEGKNIAIEYRFAEGNLKRLRELAAELVGFKVNVIVTWGTPQILAVKQATKTSPIVMAFSGDPVRDGFVASLARPGGNITGLSSVAQDLSGKRLELLKETFPQLARVGFLWDPADPAATANVKETETAGQALGAQVQPLAVRSQKDFQNAFEAASERRARALIIQQTYLTNTHRKEIVELANKHRLPTMLGERGIMDTGGLMSYGPNYSDLFRRAAVYVDKILKGAKPAELPVEQPTKFEFIVNLKTAKQIGLTIPPNVLARADRVIR